MNTFLIRSVRPKGPAALFGEYINNRGLIEYTQNLHSTESLRPMRHPRG